MPLPRVAVNCRAQAGARSHAPCALPRSSVKWLHERDDRDRAQRAARRRHRSRRSRAAADAAGRQPVRASACPAATRGAGHRDRHEANSPPGRLRPAARSAPGRRRRLHRTRHHDQGRRVGRRLSPGGFQLRGRHREGGTGCGGDAPGCRVGVGRRLRVARLLQPREGRDGNRDHATRLRVGGHCPAFVAAGRPGRPGSTCTQRRSVGGAAARATGLGGTRASAADPGAGRGSGAARGHARRAGRGSASSNREKCRRARHRSGCAGCSKGRACPAPGIIARMLEGCVPRPAHAGHRLASRPANSAAANPGGCAGSAEPRG